MEKKSNRRRRSRLALLAGVGAALLIAQTLYAITGANLFEMDGNALYNNTKSLRDWEQVYNDVTGGGNSAGTLVKAWSTDDLLDNGPSLQATIFTGGGSKDEIDINQWAWKDGAGGLPDKDNLLHAFAARYTVPASATCPSNPDGTVNPNVPCDILFFGSDRFDNSGDAHQAFWFLQNKVELNETKLGGGFGFDGVHREGDLLVISNFSNGGTTSTIIVYKWDTTVTGNLRLLASSTTANCATSDGNAAFCGIVNPAVGPPPSLTTSPWLFQDKSGNAGFANGEFFEAGINLSRLGLANECFSTLVSETRASTSTNAVLKDFIVAQLGNCQSGLVTKPTDNGGTEIGANGISIGSGSVLVKDSATLTINGVQTWAGNLEFFLCAVNTGACTTGGTKIGSTIAVTNTTTQPILSAAATVTSAGTYCWRGVFTATTSGVPNASDASTGECFTVNPVTPSIITTATATATIGQQISDSATLSLTATKPGSPVINPTTAGASADGTITFRAYGPSDPTCSGTPAFTSSAFPVSGDAIYGPASFTPTAAGTYRWIATYSGSSPNTNSAAGACNDTNETTVVSPKQPTISTVASSPNGSPVGTSLSDTATLSGTAALPTGASQGTITFTAYGPHANTTTCTTVAYTSVVTVSGDGSYNSANGSGGVFTPTQAGNYNWIAAYKPGNGDVNNLSVSGSCGDANEGSLLIKLQPTIATAQTFTIRDSATITVGAGAGNLAGSVRFRLFNNATCNVGGANELLYDSNSHAPSGIPVAGASPVTVQSNTTTITISRPVLSWLVEYTSTNTGHEGVISSCNTENSVLTINNGQ